MPLAGKPASYKRKAPLADRDVVFLANYYSTDSPTVGKAEASALAAGFPASDAKSYAPKILKKHNRAKFLSALAACGVDNLRMAMRLRRMIDTGVDKDAIVAIRLALAAKGESTDERSGAGTTVNVAQMVIVGATQDKLKALRGALPQLTAAQQATINAANAAREEEQSNARGAERLAQLKRGELPPMRTKHYNDTHRKPGDPNIRHNRPLALTDETDEKVDNAIETEAIKVEVPDINSGDAPACVEPATPEGRLLDGEGHGDAPLPIGDALPT